MNTDKEISQEELLKKKAENIRNMFGSIVRVYDFLNALLSLNFDKSWRKFAAKVSDVKTDTKVLDVCTGTGDLAISYSKLLNGNGLVVGSDYCHDMLRYGLPKIKKRHLENKIKLIEADTLQLPFRDNAFEISTVTSMSADILCPTDLSSSVTPQWPMNSMSLTISLSILW